MAALIWSKLLIRTGIAAWLPSVRRLMDQKPQYLRYFSDRVLAAPLPEMLDEATFPESPAADVIHLDLAAPKLESYALRSPRGLSDRRSTWGMPELRETIVDTIEHDAGVRFSPIDEVLITPGASGALTVALDSFVNPGSKVVVFDPTSPLFRIGLKSRRAKLRTVPAWVEDGGRLRFPLDRFVKAMRGARMLVLADPANPHGGCLASEDLEQITWWAKRNDTLIYLDETLSRYRDEPLTSHLAKMPNAAGRILLANSVSKGYGLGHLRVGWLAGTKHLLRAAAVTGALNTASVAQPCQEIALAALRSNSTSFAEVRENLQRRRRYLMERLTMLGLPTVAPGGGFCLWVSTEPIGMTGREFATAFLRDKRVLVGPGDVFGPSGSHRVRISYAAEDGRLREGITRLSEYLMERRSPEMGTPPMDESENGAGDARAELPAPTILRTAV